MTVTWFSCLNWTNASDWESQVSSVVALCLGAAFAYMAGQRSGWLLSLLVLLPVSHYDVPQQGLLGELILIQQQIQRHEEEVRRAAAANNARPPPPEPAPSPPPNPSPPQQKRKVKVPTHLDPPYPTKASSKIREEIEYFFLDHLISTIHSDKINTRLKSRVSLSQ